MSSLDRTVLVVEDDPSVREMLKEAFQAFLDVRVVTAKDGIEALREAERVHPEVIVLDMVLPEMDGFAVAPSLKSRPSTSHIPVIGVTASIRAIPEALNAGCDYCLGKPFDLDELVAAVESYVRSAQPVEE